MIWRRRHGRGLLLFSLICVASFVSCIDWDCVFMKDCISPGWREAEKQRQAEWKALQADAQLCHGLYVKVHKLQEAGLKPPSIHRFPLATIPHPTADDREQAKGVIDATITLMPVCGAKDTASAMSHASQSHSFPSDAACHSCIDSAFQAAVRQIEFDAATLNGEPVTTRIHVRYRFVDCDDDALCAQIDVDPPSILSAQ